MCINLQTAPGGYWRIDRNVLQPVMTVYRQYLLYLIMSVDCRALHTLSASFSGHFSFLNFILGSNELSIYFTVNTPSGFLFNENIPEFDKVLINEGNCYDQATAALGILCYLYHFRQFIAMFDP